MMTPHAFAFVGPYFNKMIADSLNVGTTLARQSSQASRPTGSHHNQHHLELDVVVPRGAKVVQVIQV